MQPAREEVVRKLDEGNRDSVVDGVSTAMILSGWARASFPICCDSHIAFAHSKSFKCLPGDRGQTVLIHPGGRYVLTAGLTEGDTTFEPGEAIAPVYAAVLAKDGYAEFWAGSGETDDLLARIKVESVAGPVVTLASGVPTIPANGQVVPILRGYSPVRGTNGLEGAAQFVDDQTERLGNDGEVSALVPAGLEVGIRFNAATHASRIAGDEAALAITCMFRGPEVET